MTGQVQQEYNTYKNEKVNMLQSFNVNAFFFKCSLIYSFVQALEIWELKSSWNHKRIPSKYTYKFKTLNSIMMDIKQNICDVMKV